MLFVIWSVVNICTLCVAHPSLAGCFQDGRQTSVKELYLGSTLSWNGRIIHRQFKDPSSSSTQAMLSASGRRQWFNRYSWEINTVFRSFEMRLVSCHLWYQYFFPMQPNRPRCPSTFNTLLELWEGRLCSAWYFLKDNRRSLKKKRKITHP